MGLIFEAKILNTILVSLKRSKTFKETFFPFLWLGIIKVILDALLDTHQSFILLLSIFWFWLIAIIWTWSFVFCGLRRCLLLRVFCLETKRWTYIFRKVPKNYLAISVAASNHRFDATPSESVSRLTIVSNKYQIWIRRLTSVFISYTLLEIHIPYKDFIVVWVRS